MFNGSAGMQAARLLEQLGLPSQVGQALGAQVDSARGDIPGVMRNLQAMTSSLSTAQMDALFGRGVPPQGFVPRPLNAFQAMLGSPIPRGFNPFAAMGAAPFGPGMLGQSIAQAMTQNPAFLGAFQQQLGGQLLPGLGAGGALQVFRSPVEQLGGIMKSVFAGGMMASRGIAGMLGGLGLPMTGPLMGNPITGSIMGGLQRMEANIAAFAQGLTGNDSRMGFSKQQLISDPQTQTMAQGMGIDVRNASFEDIIALLLMKYAKNKETDVMKKVQELDKSMKAAEDKKKAGGKEGEAQAANGGTGAGLTGTDLGGQMDPSQMSDTMKQQALQKLMSDLQKTYEMLTNMMKSMHDMQMSPIRNLRG
jgi:hypothetical protein